MMTTLDRVLRIVIVLSMMLGSFPAHHALAQEPEGEDPQQYYFPLFLKNADGADFVSSQPPDKAAESTAEPSLQPAAPQPVSGDKAAADSLEAGPPAKIRLSAKATPKERESKEERVFSLAVQVVDADKLPVADGTSIQLTSTGGTLQDTTLLTEGGMASTQLRLAKGQQATVTAQVGAVEESLQIGGNAPNDPGRRFKNRSPGYDLDVEARIAARNKLDDLGSSVESDNPYRTVSASANAGMTFEYKDGNRRDRLTVRLTDISIGQTSLFERPISLSSVENWAIFQPNNGDAWEMGYFVLDDTIQQYIVIEEPDGIDGDLVIEGQFQTNMDVTLLSSDEGFRFRSRGDPEDVLGFGAVTIIDDDGKRTQGQLGLNGKQYSITVAADWLRRAEFPIVVDPVIGAAELVSILTGDASSSSVQGIDLDHFFTVWEHNGDIYGQIISTTGVLSGSVVTISDAAATQNKPDVIHNGEEYMVAWVDHRFGGSNNVIMGQRLNEKTGALLGDEFAISSVEQNLGTNGGVNGAYNRDSETLWVWSHQATGRGVFGQLVDNSDGSLSGSQITISDKSNDQRSPDVAYDDLSDHFLVVFEDDDGSEFDITGQRLSITGTLTGTEIAIGDSAASNDDLQSPAVAENNNQDQFLVVWHEERTSSDYDVYAQRIDSATGTKTGSAIGVSTGGGRDFGASVVARNPTVYHVAWTEGAADMNTQQINSSGSLLGSPLNIGSGQVASLTIDRNNVLITWSDDVQAAQQVIVGQLIAPSGVITGDAFSISPNFTIPEPVDAAYQTSVNEYTIAWPRAEATAEEDIFIQRVDNQAKPIGSATNATSDGETEHHQPDIVVGAGQQLVAWTEVITEDNVDLYAHFLDATGALSGTVITVSTAIFEQDDAALAYNSDDNEYLIAWHDYRDWPSNGADMFFQIIEADGSLKLGSDGTLTENNNQKDVAAAYNPDEGEYLIVWEDNRPGSVSYDIYGQVISSDGSLSGADFEISGASSPQYNPTVAYDPVEKVYLATWHDKRNGNFDIYGQIISGTGSLSGSNFAISTDTTNQEETDVVAGAGDEFAVVWYDRRNSTNRDIYLQRIDGSGNLLDDSDTAADETDPTVNVPIEVDSDSYLNLPSVTYNNDDAVYLISWTNQDDGGVYSRRYSSSAPITPTASFAPTPESGVVPLTVSFSDTSTGQIGNREWDFGDGDSLSTTDTLISHTYSATGTYTVVLTVSNPTASSTASDTITVTSQTTPGLDQDFEGFDVGTDPEFWVDQRHDTTVQDEYDVMVLGLNRVLGTDYTANSIYSTYAPPGWQGWQNYEYTGRMRMSDASAELGVTIYSGYPDSNQKAYRLRNGSGSNFELSPVGTTMTGTLATTITPQADTWYQFRIQASTLVSHTIVRSKVWTDTATEPDDWQVAGIDDTGTRISGGAMGVYSNGPGEKYFDDLAVAPAPETMATISSAGGLIQADEGNLWLDFDSDAVTDTLIIEIEQAYMGGPITQTNPIKPLNGVPFKFIGLTAYEPDDLLTEVPIQFADTVTLTYAYTQSEIEERVEPTLRVVFFNDQTEKLDVIPTTVDTSTLQLTSVITHFSPYGLLADEAALGGPSIDAFGVALSKGQATFNYDVPLPSGPNGFGPNLTLRYSSAVPNSMHGEDNTDTGWVGVGWSLDIGRITGKGDEAYLSLNGVSERIRQSEVDPNLFYTEHQTYKRIKRVPAENREMDSGCGRIETDGYHWEVTHANGTTYYFGINQDTEGTNAIVSKMKKVRVSNGSHQWQLRDRVYKLYKVVDIHGNQMDITYDHKRTSTRCGATAVNESYPEFIRYTRGNDTRYEYEVAFDLEQKGYDLVGNDHREEFHGEVGYRLDKIRTRHYDTPTTSQAIHEIDFSYSFDNDDEWSRLDSIQVKAGAGSLAYPPMSFDYTEYEIRHRREGSFTKQDRWFLEEVTHDYGSKIEYIWENWQASGKTIFQVVDKRKVTDNIALDTGLTSTYDYIYGDANGGTDNYYRGRHDQQSFGRFYGFAIVTEKVLPQGHYTKHYFNNAYIEKDYKNDDAIEHPFNGIAHQTWGYGADNKLYTVSKPTWVAGVDPSWPEDVTFVYQQDSHTYSCEGKDVSGNFSNTLDLSDCIYQRSHSTYDLQYGQLKTQTNYDDSGSVHRSTETTYFNNPTPWLLGLPKTQVLKDGSGNTVGETRFYYDGNENNLSNPGSGSPTKGNLTLQRVVSGTQYVDTVMPLADYDDYGNATKQIVYNSFGTASSVASQNARTTTTTFDNQGLLPTQVKNPEDHTVITKYDYRFQVPEEVTDANGKKTTYRYDNLGRLTEVKLPLETHDFSYKFTYPTATSFSSSSPYSEQQTQHLGNTTLVSDYAYYDGFGRRIQTRMHSDDSDFIVSHAKYDELGRVSDTSVPTSGSGSAYVAPNWSNLDVTNTTYDPLSRPTTITAPDDTETRFLYAKDKNLAVPKHAYSETLLFRRTVYDANDHVRQEVTDLFGNLIRVREFSGNNNGEGVYALYAETEYDYDIRNNLTQVTDEDDNVTDIDYDALSRKTEMDDPDMGVWKYSYDAMGNLTQQLDANEDYTCFYYDTLNRVEDKAYQDTTCGATAPASPFASYVYDQGTNGKGRRTQMTDVAGTVDWNYDARGRVLRESRTLSGDYDVLINTGSSSTFATTYEYNNADWPTDLGYPDGEVVSTEYTNRGLVDVLDTNINVNPYISSASYNDLAQMTERVARNTLTTDYTYYTAGVSGTPYEGGNNRLKSINLTNSLLDISYKYDSMGNIRQIEDLVNSNTITQSFTYDHRNRLTDADPVGTQVTGVSYTADYAYNEIGNILTRTVDSTTDVYTYDEVDAGPHAVTDVGSDEYVYDANGNMTERTEDTVIYTQDWTKFNKLDQVSWTANSTDYITTFVYDGDGNRLLKIEDEDNGVDPATETTTLYIGQIYEKTFDTTDDPLSAALLTMDQLRAAIEDTLEITITPRRSAGLAAPLPKPVLAPLAGTGVQTKTWTSQTDFLGAISATDVDRYDTSGSLKLRSLDDDFTDNTLNLDRWQQAGSVYLLQEQNQRLEQPASEDDHAMRLIDNQSLSGDFEVEVDYGLLNWNPTTQDPVSPRMQLRVHCENGNHAWMQMANNSNNTAEYRIETWFNIGHSSFVREDDAEDDTDWKDGTLRIKRVGTQWTLSYKASTQINFTTTLTKTEAQIGNGAFGDCYVILSTDAWDGGNGSLPINDFSGFFDNFTVNGNASESNWQYVSSGTWQAEVDGGVGNDGLMDWQTLKWDAGSLNGGTATFKARGCDLPGGIDCTSWQSASLSPSGSLTLDNSSTGLQGRRVLQVEIELDASSNNSASPQVDSLSLIYDQEAVNVPDDDDVTKYYFHGAQRVAMKQGAAVHFLSGDHLGSTSLTTNASGTKVHEARYLPFGQERWPNDDGAITDFAFTSQRRDSFGLDDYNARYFSSRLGRFISADSVVPDPGNSQAWNRYAYVLNNPLKFIDPSGHCNTEADDYSECMDWVDQIQEDFNFVTVSLCGSGAIGGSNCADWTANQLRLVHETLNEHMLNEHFFAPVVIARISGIAEEGGLEPGGAYFVFGHSNSPKNANGRAVLAVGDSAGLFDPESNSDGGDRYTNFKALVAHELTHYVVHSSRHGPILFEKWKAFDDNIAQLEVGVDLGQGYPWPSDADYETRLRKTREEMMAIAVSTAMYGTFGRDGWFFKGRLHGLENALTGY